MADAPTAGAARYASVAEVRADVERAGGDTSVLCGLGRCFCVKAAPGISGRKERGHWPRFQEADRNRRLLATAIAAFDSLGEHITYTQASPVKAASVAHCLGNRTPHVTHPNFPPPPSRMPRPPRRSCE